MTKAELVEAVAEQTRLTKKAAAELIDVVFDNIGAAVKKDARFSYPGFGTWSIRTRKARKIRNPQTNEIMKLKATRTIGFRPAKELKATNLPSAEMLGRNEYELACDPSDATETRRIPLVWRS